MPFSGQVDYSLYLVTGRELLPQGKDYYESLEESLQGGVTIVQVREKNTDTREFLEIARKSKEICERYNVPLLINDRLDIALASNADGVHLGQTDMPVETARKLLPSGSIIGKTCNTLEQVKQAVAEDVHYVGLGPVYPTDTKKDASPATGVRKIGTMLEILGGTSIKAVVIGGIKSKNALRVLFGSRSITDRSIDGLAIVSDIVASRDPQAAAKRLHQIVSSYKSGLVASSPRTLSEEEILSNGTAILQSIKTSNPLVHQITNTVVATQSANITLALGASPIMATSPEEMEDLAKVCGALLVNIGTINPATKESMHSSGVFVNAEKKPVVLDPVGVGASKLRKATVNSLLDTWQASVIKGNAGELAAIAGSTEVTSKGVDSVGTGFRDPRAFVRALAKKERCVVVLTGPIDYVSDGHVVVALSNGHPLLGQITGSGCGLGTIIASCCAAASGMANTEAQGVLVKGDMLLGAIAGVLALTVAAEIAAEKVDGPGGFLAALLDALAALSADDVKTRAKIEISY